MRRIAALSILLVAFTATNLPAQSDTSSPISVTSATTTFSPEFTGKLEQAVAAHEGTMGIYIRNLKSGEEIAINADVPMPTASTIKVPIMCAAFDLLASGKGPFKDYYDTRILETSSSVGGAGFLQNYKDKTKVELKELMHLMITVSDNFATNMLVDWIGIGSVNVWLEKNGFEQTRIFSTVFGRQIADAEGRKQWGLGRTTCREMGQLLGMIYDGKAGTAATCDEMLRLLGHQYFDGNIASNVPPTTWVGSKGGSVNDSRSDCAIVSGPTATYILIVYTKDNKDRSWGKTNAAELAIGRISAMTWKHYEPTSTWERPTEAEKF